MILSDLGGKSKSGGFSSELQGYPSVYWWLALLIAATLFVILSSLGVSDPVYRQVRTISRPLTTPVFTIYEDIYALINGVLSVPEQNSELAQLRQENISLESSLAEVELIFERYQELKQAVGADYVRDYELMPATVIGRQSGASSRITINKGSSDGVEEGQVVVIEKFIIGEVIDVEPRASRVRLIIDSQVSMPVKTSDESLGILEGQGNSRMLVTQILPDRDVEIGDNVYSSGVNSNYPPELVLGKVTQVEADPRQATKTATVESPVAWNQINRVTVLQ